jgi:DNA-binding PadR family transcriptional regulator
MEAGLSEDLLIKCVERLVDDGLLTAEDRKDGNALRLIVSTSDAGRRLLADGVEGSAAPGVPSDQEEPA